MVLVDDVVARTQVGEAGERPAGRRGLPRRLAPEDLRVGKESDAELPPDEASPGGCHGEGEARRLGTGREDRSLDAAQERAASLGLAAVGERDDHVEPLSQEPRELVLGLRQAACDERRALSLERVRLSLREGIELGAAVERDPGETLVVPDCPHFVGLPDEVGGAFEGSDEIGR